MRDDPGSTQGRCWTGVAAPTGRGAACSWRARRRTGPATAAPSSAPADGAQQLAGRPPCGRAPPPREWTRAAVGHLSERAALRIAVPDAGTTDHFAKQCLVIAEESPTTKDVVKDWSCSLSTRTPIPAGGSRLGRLTDGRRGPPRGRSPRPSPPSGDHGRPHERPRPGHPLPLQLQHEQLIATAYASVLSSAHRGWPELGTLADDGRSAGPSP